MAETTPTIKVSRKAHNLLRRNAFRKRKSIAVILDQLLGLTT